MREHLGGVMVAEEMARRCGESTPNTVTALPSSAGTGRHRLTRGAIVGTLSVLGTLSTSVWAQGAGITTWVMADEAYRAGLSAMAIRYDATTGHPAYHFVYEKSVAAAMRDRRRYYRRYSAAAWEDEVEVSNRITQPAHLTTPSEGISYLV